MICKQSLVHLPLFQNLFRRFKELSASRCQLRYLTYLQGKKEKEKEKLQHVLIDSEGTTKFKVYTKPIAAYLITYTNLF